MTLSQIIKLRTGNGRDIVDFLVDVMQDRFRDFRICHRLQAARLLATYGNEDAPNFIADNTSDTPTARRNGSKATRQTKFDTELARVIREDTDDGRSVARFLVNVMEGELRTFMPHHRMAAARELLNRGFGKSARTSTIRRSGEGRNPEIASSTVIPQPVEGPTPNRHSGEGTACTDPIRRSGEGTACPVLDTGSPRTTIRGRNPESASSTIIPQPVEGPTPNRHSGEGTACTDPIRRSGEGTACPVLDTGSPRTTIRGRNPESASSTIIPQPVEGPTPNRHSGEGTACTDPIRRSGEGTACPVLDTGSPRTTIRGRNPEIASSTIIPQPVEGPNPDAAHTLTPHSSPLTPQREAPPHSSPLTPQREAPPHSSPLTPGESGGLATDLLDTLTHILPSGFEHTVLDLLDKMGYGHGRHTGRTGDGGIDGIIDQDTLGLDSVYVQAKRWTSQVGEPEIRSFSGSLDPHGATRGILITTSDFSESARRTAETISTGSKHIRLVDGRELAQLMIRHSVGVTTGTPHHARKNVTPYSDTGLDENYFNQHT